MHGAPLGPTSPLSPQSVATGGNGSLQLPEAVQLPPATPMEAVWLLLADVMIGSGGQPTASNIVHWANNHYIMTYPKT